jgi:hypothetical protein
MFTCFGLSLLGATVKAQQPCVGAPIPAAVRLTFSMIRIIPTNMLDMRKRWSMCWATAMGRQAEFVPSDWETLVSALQRKSFDVIVNGLERWPCIRSF